MSRFSLVRNLGFTTRNLRNLHRPDPWQMDSLLDIGSRKIFEEEHDQIRHKLRHFFESVDKERIQLWEDQGKYE